MADAITHIEDVARAEADKLKEAARQADNEFNIRKQFLENSVEAIRQATLSQYNIVIRTDQQHDDFQNLVGEILPMQLIEVEVAKDKMVNFQVSVFDTGKYLRHGRWENDAWWYWGYTKKWTDPAAMHVHFETAQKKLDPQQVKDAMDKKAQEDKTAADAKKAADAAQQQTKAADAAQLKAEAAKKATDAQAQTQAKSQDQEGAPGSSGSGYNGSQGIELSGSGGAYDQSGYGGADNQANPGGEFSDASERMILEINTDAGVGANATAPSGPAPSFMSRECSHRIHDREKS